MKCECSILKLKLCEVKDTYFDAAGNPKREVTVINLNKPDTGWVCSVFFHAAVVGFRAGMVAWFLYGEKETRTVRKNTIAFAQWVADQMLTQHMLRFEIDGKGSNTNKWEEAYSMLGNKFTIENLEQALIATASSTPMKNVL